MHWLILPDSLTDIYSVQRFGGWDCHSCRAPAENLYLRHSAVALCCGAHPEKVLGNSVTIPIAELKARPVRWLQYLTLNKGGDAAVALLTWLRWDGAKSLETSDPNGKTTKSLNRLKREGAFKRQDGWRSQDHPRHGLRCDECECFADTLFLAPNEAEVEEVTVRCFDHWIDLAYWIQLDGGDGLYERPIRWLRHLSQKNTGEGALAVLRLLSNNAVAHLELRHKRRAMRTQSN